MSDERIQRVTMPKWGLSMETGKITEWLVGEGDVIADGVDLAEIDTDKIAGTLESTQAGLLRRIVADAGVEIPVGGTIAVVAPAEVPDSEIDEVVAQARAQLASGEVEVAAGPAIATVEVGGRSLSYAALGDGAEVVVLVHGFGGDKNSWLFVQEPLAEARTVYALDLPGHGASTKDVGDGSLDTLAAGVLGFLDALGVPAAHLVGHSMGGAVVATVAAAAPERVRSLTLLAPAGLGPDINAGYLRGFAESTSRRELKPLLAALFADPGQVTRQLVDDVLRYKRLDGVDAVLRTLLGTLLDGDRSAIDIRPILTASTVPTVVVWGTEDQVIPVASADGLPARITIRRVSHAGHLIQLEAPTEVRSAITHPSLVSE